MTTSSSMAATLSLLPLSGHTFLPSRPRSLSLTIVCSNVPFSLSYRAHPLSHVFSASAALDAVEADAGEQCFGLRTNQVICRLLLGMTIGRVFSGAHAYARWTPNGLWEDPDDGNDSGTEEMDYEEEEEGSDDVGEMKVSAVKDDKCAVAQYEDLMKEVELLLEPEEKAILQENEFSNVKKISTVKWNIFHSFALSGQMPLMDRLIEQALHKAVIGKKEAVISHLLRKGANPHVRDRNGATPLHYAVQVGAMQTVKLLIKFKVDVNVADNDGWTPLHVAMQTRCRDITKVLLINGADKTRRTKDGKTPLDLSLCYGKDFKSFDIAKLLKLVPANRDL
ncbi:ankyrin repeat domain-containing protein EMB506, chloroplastic-like isoform X3 [Zingiber officinale]|uniref:ankyrin repeat domain-containing protein EMB506, chloroplastic-like isoform X3 n=1 Tax=Zingiber officinale TaxID=94328 RepID=UPI001C4DD57C|nr:ankyrin repeat domain-containing protein EMB506, chloroplastic-like isoform X3 [Zingiber officinale]